MVNPRLPALTRLDRDSADLQRRFKGLVRRGRVAAVNRLYRNVVDVDIVGYGGQTARITDLPILSTAYDLSPPATPRIGADVLILVPSGDISDGGYILGVVAKPAIMGDNLQNPARGSVRVGPPSTTETIAGNLRQDADPRTLRVVGLAVATAGGVNAVPRAKVTLTDSAGTAVADAEYRARQTYGDAGKIETVGGTGDTLPNIVLEGELEARLAGGEPYRLSVELYASAINTLPPGAGGRASQWAVYVTEAADQFPAASEALLVFDAPSGPVPLVRVYGSAA